MRLTYSSRILTAIQRGITKFQMNFKRLVIDHRRRDVPRNTRLLSIALRELSLFPPAASYKYDSIVSCALTPHRLSLTSLTSSIIRSSARRTATPWIMSAIKALAFVSRVTALVTPVWWITVVTWREWWIDWSWAVARQNAIASSAAERF